jgi:hypothetical protein
MNAEPANPAGEGGMMIADLAADTEHYTGQTITITGVFQDFQVGMCRFPDGVAAQPQTRSDWLLLTDQDCIYVTGGLPIGIDPMNSDHLGRAVTIQAVVEQNNNQEIYLLFRN